MNNEIQFNLNLAIQGWRNQLAQSPALQAENLDELETHLRDSVAAIQARGLNDEEAFMVAAHRIGKNDPLEREFAKLNQKTIWLERVLWMLIGIQAWGLVSGLSGLTTRAALAYGWIGSGYVLKDRGMSMVLQVTSFAFFQIIMWAVSLCFCWWLIVIKGRTLGVWLSGRLQRQSSFVMVCGALCVISVLHYVVNFAFNNVLLKFVTLPAFGEFQICTTLSSIAVGLIQIVAMSAVTLVLLRKRFQITAQAKKA